MNAPSHDEVAGAALRWALERPWARAGCVELAFGGGRVDAVVVSGMPQERDLQREEEGREHDRWARERRRPRRGRTRPPTAGPPRIGVIEAKATRSDLLSDLRQQKMHTYSELASQCWLAVAPAALLEKPGQGVTERCRRRLDDLDLPTGWGVLLCRVDDRLGPFAVSLRPARRLRDDVTAAEVEGWTSRIARSTSWRLLEGS